MMRLRTVWDWRLRLYPLIVIPAMVWINFVAAQTSETPYRASQVESPSDSRSVAATPCCVCFEGKIVQRFCWRLTEERR